MDSETRLASRARELCGHITLDKLTGPALGLCLAITVLKFLIILYLNLCFISEVQWDSGPHA